MSTIPASNVEAKANGTTIKALIVKAMVEVNILLKKKVFGKLAFTYITFTYIRG